jgi:hypothetical protein
MEPLLTFRHGENVVWQHGPDYFEDFDFPLDALVSDDGKWLVFGGASAGNVSFDTQYKEGLRFYSTSGRLVRFVSRRDLPVGDFGITTSNWYDSYRTRLNGTRLEFFTPSRPNSLVFDITTGRIAKGSLIVGQGDDSHHQDWFLKNFVEPLEKKERRPARPRSLQGRRPESHCSPQVAGGLTFLCSRQTRCACLPLSS